MSLALILTFCFGSIHWQYLACSLEGTQWVCAASTATHIRKTSWLQAGKYPNEPCNITWFCARITFCMVGTTVYEHCFLVFCLLVQNVQPTHSSVMWLQVLLLSAAMMSRFCCGIPGIWGSLSVKVPWVVECGGWSGILPINTCCWQPACTMTSISLTASRHLVSVSYRWIWKYHSVVLNDHRNGKWILKSDRKRGEAGYRGIVSWHFTDDLVCVYISACLHIQYLTKVQHILSVTSLTHCNVWSSPSLYIFLNM